MKTKAEPASEKQINALIKAGYRSEELEKLTLKEASRLLDVVAKNGWHRPKEETAIVRMSDKELSERAIPLVDDAALDKLAECLTDEDDFYYERDLRQDLRDCLTKTVKELGGILGQYKSLYGRRGKWLLLLSALHISERTAYRWMQMGRIDVPAPLTPALEAAGVRLDTKMTSRDERITRLAVDNYEKLTPVTKTPQPIDSTRAASQAVKQAMEQVVPPSPKPEVEIRPVDTYGSAWETLEQILSCLQHDPNFHDRLLKVLEQYAPEVVTDVMSA